MTICVTYKTILILKVKESKKRLIFFENLFVMFTCDVYDCNIQHSLIYSYTSIERERSVNKKNLN